MSIKLPSFKTYSILSGVLIANELLSYLGYRYHNVGIMLFVLMIILTGMLAWKRLEWGIAVLLAELCVGGKGYLYSVELHGFTLSIRIALFCTLMFIWLIRYRARTTWRALPKLLRWIAYALGACIVWGVIHGIIANNGFQSVFLDVNAYLFFLLIVVLLAPSIDWGRFATTVIAIIGAAATVLGIKSVVSLSMFAHLSIGGLTQYYRWIRNTGVGEVAHIRGSSYRVFFQSQIYGLFGLLLLAPYVLPRRGTAFNRKRLWLLLPMTLGLTAVLVSLSRSFWLGGVIAVLTGIIIGFMRYRWTFKQLIGILVVAALMYGCAYTLMSWSVDPPNPFSPSSHTDSSTTEKMIKERFSNFGGEAAAASRLQMLQPLLSAILKDPVFGSGFATTVTYQSDDPRQLQSESKGVYTTDAFELGYLDISLKIGLVGLLAYVALLAVVMRALWKHRSDVAFGMLLAVVALMGVHLTTPYLNHPLGIGLLLIAIVIGFVLPKTTGRQV